MRPLGFEVGPGVYGPRGIIGEVGKTAAGNVVIRVGRAHDRPVHGSERRGGWEQTEHVVLTPDEADALIEAVAEARRDAVGNAARALVRLYGAESVPFLKSCLSAGWLTDLERLAMSGLVRALGDEAVPE